MVYLMLYAASGFFSLALQVIWQRQLLIITGGTMYSVAGIISDWMIGLAIGSFFGGKLSRNEKTAGTLFCLTQILAGAYVLASPAIFHIVNHLDARIFLLQQSHEALSILLRTAIVFLVLVIPVGLIGAGFPMISNFLGKQRIASLYYVNALGSVAGAFIVSFFFLEKLGVRSSATLLSIGLILLNIIVLFVTKKSAKTDSSSALTPMAEKNPFGLKLPAASRNLLLMLLPFLFFLSGFSSLSYELLYNRIILFIFKESSYYSFAIILILFILGITAGSFLYAIFGKKIKSISGRLAWFALVECAIGLWHIMLPKLSVFIFTEQLVINPKILPAHYFWGTVCYRTSVAAVLMLLPIIAFGFLYPLVVELYVNVKNKNTSETVGFIGFFNLIGSAIGPLVTVFVLIAAFQVGGALRLVSLLNILIGAAIILFIISRKEFSNSKIKSAAFIAVPVIMIFIALRTSGSFELFQYLARDVESAVLLYYKENPFSTISVTSSAGGVRMLSINCISEVPTDYNALRTFRLLAYLPFMVKDRAQSALTIAFGGGITFGSACQVPGLKDVRCAEICKDVLDVAGYFSDLNHAVITTNRSDVVIEDGRRYVEKSQKNYDVIICDLTHPSLSDSWVLFTQEFYASCASKLNAGGVMAQWVPIHGLPLSDYKVILRTFSNNFKEVALFFVNNYTILLGSASPITLSPHALEALLESPVAADDLKKTNLNTMQDIERMRLMNTVDVRNFAGQGDIATEDHSPVQFSQKRLIGVSNSQLEICSAFSDYLARNSGGDRVITDYQRATLKLREYVYQKDLVNLLACFANEKKALSEKGAFDDEIIKTITSEDVVQMFFTHFLKGNGLDTLLTNPTEGNVKALETLGTVVFPKGDESDFLKGALYYQAKKYDLAQMTLLQVFQKSPFENVSKLIIETSKKLETPGQSPTTTVPLR